MSELLKRLNKERKEIIAKGKTSFSEEYINDAYMKYELIIKHGYKENKNTKDYIYYKEDEYNLIKRLDKYKDNHLLFIKDFSVPFDNNISENKIRQVKQKMVVSFLFKNIVVTSTGYVWNSRGYYQYTAYSDPFANYSNGTFNKSSATYLRDVYPVFYLNSSVHYISGTSTIDNPIRIQ